MFNTEHRSVEAITERPRGQVESAAATAIATLRFHQRHQNVAVCRNWSAPRAAPASGVHRLLHRRYWSRTTKLAADFRGDPAPRPPSCRGRIPLNGASRSASRRSALASVWRDETRGADGDAAIGQARPRARRIHVRISRQAGDRVLWDHKDVASCEATPQHHWSRQNLRAAQHPRADEPAGALGRSPRRHLVRHRSRASSTCSAPTTRRH